MEKKLWIGMALLVISALSVLGASADPYWFYEDFCECSYSGNKLISCGPSLFGVATSSPETCITSQGFELRIPAGLWSSAIVPGSDPQTEIIYSDFSVRAQFRKLQCQGEIGFGARWHGKNLGYWAAISPRSVDHLFIGRRIEAGPGSSLSWGEIELNVCSQDVVLQLDVEGGSLRLWAWEAGGIKPQGALYAEDPAPLTPGGLMVYTYLLESERPVYDLSVLRLFAVFPVGEEPFMRGDPNADGDVNMADAIFTLGYLFGAGPAPSCMDAADANDDGTIDIGDPIALLHHLFGSEATLAGPVEKCGVDPTALEGLSCLSYPPCESARVTCE